MISDKLKSLASASGIKVSEKQVGGLTKFVEIFTEKNKVINLTKINSEEEFLIKHIIDSIFAGRSANLKKGMQVADIGTGGGLPGIPLAIMYPETDFVLIDSVQKKIRCVAEFAENLKLKNITGISGRLEEIGQNRNFREQFDVIISRALASLPVLLELALPLVKKGGCFLALKGPNFREELESAQNAIRLLKADKPELSEYVLPENMGERSILIFRKTIDTPKMYPRRTGVPGNNPL